MDQAPAFLRSQGERRKSPVEEVLNRVAERFDANAAFLAQHLRLGFCQCLHAAGGLSMAGCCRNNAGRTEWRFRDEHDSYGRDHDIVAWSDEQGYWLCGRRSKERRAYPHLIVHRSPDDRPFLKEDAQRMAALLPDLLTGLIAGHELTQLRREAGYFGRVFADLPLPVVLISEQLEVLAANESGRRVLDQGDGLACRNGKLKLDRRAMSELAAALGAGQDSGAHINVARPSGAPPYVLSLFVADRMPHSELMVGALVIRGAEALPRRPSPVVRRAFNLTEAEARLAHYLADGHSLASAAAVLGISQNTARTHMKRIYAKTGTQRQTELVRVMLGMMVEA